MSVFKAGRVIAGDNKWTGDEPDWHGWEQWTVQRFFRVRSRALNFYNYYLDSSSMKPMVLEWMKKNGYNKDEISCIKEAPPYALPSTVGKLVRCLERGLAAIHPYAEEYYASLPFHDETNPPIPKNDQGCVHNLIGDALKVLKQAKQASAEEIVTAAPKAYVPSPLERIKKNVEKDILAPLDSLLDDWGNTSKSPQSMDLAGSLRNNKVPVQGCKFILDWINRHHEEYNAALQKTDKECVEGFAYLSKPSLRKIVKILEDFIVDVQSHAKIKNNSRKPRIKKVKNADKQVARLQYQTNSAEYNIDSINPARIPTSQRLYTFNTKTKQLNVYYASGSSGFTVQGTTVKMYDAESSFGATLRKPKDILAAILGATPKKLDKIFDGLPLKKKKVNGRINSQTIILKAIENRI
jgi:hypothetical protein